MRQQTLMHCLDSAWSAWSDLVRSRGAHVLAPAPLTRPRHAIGEDAGLWAWDRFNAVFNMMPLAAVIEKRVICMHGARSSWWPCRRRPGLPLTSYAALRSLYVAPQGGIGKSIETVEQLELLQRPLTMETGGMVLMDLLWRCDK